MAEFGNSNHDGDAKIKFYYIFRPHILYHPSTLRYIFQNRLAFPYSDDNGNDNTPIIILSDAKNSNANDDADDDATTAITTSFNYTLSKRNLRQSFDNDEKDETNDDTDQVDDDSVDDRDGDGDGNNNVDNDDAEDDPNKNQDDVIENEDEIISPSSSSSTMVSSRNNDGTDMDFLFWNFGSSKPAFPYHDRRKNTIDDTMTTTATSMAKKKEGTSSFPSSKMFGLDSIHDKLIDIQRRDIGYYFGADNPWIKNVPDIHPCMPGIPDDQINWMLYILLQKLT